MPIVVSRWSILAVLFFARAAMAYQFQTVASVGPILIDTLHIDYSALGTLIGLYMLPGVVFALPGGMLGQRFGSKQVVLAGLAGGWAVTRVGAAQSPLTTVTVATDTTALRTHDDALGFTAQVPQNWTERRADGAVSFVSPDGSEELTVSRADSADEVAQALTPEALGTTEVQVDPRKPVPGTDATQLVYRTADAGRHRTGWVRVLPAGNGVLAVRMTAPGGSSAPWTTRAPPAAATSAVPSDERSSTTSSSWTSGSWRRPSRQGPSRPASSRAGMTTLIVAVGGVAVPARSGSRRERPRDKRARTTTVAAP